MNRRRLALAGAGVLLVAAVAVAGGSLAGFGPAERLVGVFGNDYLLVAAVGTGVLLGAAVTAERGGVVDQTEMPDPEEAVTVPAPGDEFAETVDRWWVSVPFAGSESRRTVRDRLRETAVATVRRTRNCSRAEAVERVRDGRWTDDDRAAAFLSTDSDRVPVGALVAAAARGEPWFADRARRTADAIAALDDGAEARR